MLNDNNYKKMRKGLIAKSAAMIAIALLIAGCGGDRKKSKGEPEVKKVLVRTAPATTGTVKVQEEFTGTIEAYKVNKISPSIAGRIDDILVDVGDRVRKGQLLVEMDKNQYLQTNVQLENIKTDLERYRNLYKEGGISKQQLDQMETQVEVAEHALDNLKDNTDLISPINGLVTERLYDPGDVYSSADGRIVTVIQIDKVKVQVNISEMYFPSVYIGMPVDIRLDVYPGEVFVGNISLIYPAIDPATRTFTIEITIPNSNEKIRPGMFARVMLNFGEKESVLVSDVAVQKQVGSNERFIFVIKDGVAHRRVITPGRIIGNEYEVLSGVVAGEEVVIAGAQKLLDQAEVEITM